MVNKINKVSNPLTIVAIFAGLAEVAGTVALGLLDSSTQRIFIYFVMGFPVLLVSLFFLVLYHKHSVLYSPSDFDNQEHFLRVARGKVEFDNNINEITSQISQFKEEIYKEISSLSKDSEVKTDLEKKIENVFSELSSKIEDTKLSADGITQSALSSSIYIMGKKERTIYTIIKNNPNVDINGIINELTKIKVEIPRTVLSNILRSLLQNGIVDGYAENGITSFTVKRN
ncbi:hypothetical protein PPOLYM_02579 [Paenibacillus polymyxa]|uniref:hypothetical protein n=1 Tax=Paenibacillus polymyxa TaxID=1406 RepID=UPI000947C607|nr:hypothetical protein [Paenibacillus polymyxa]VUG06186.1 hypothetical protein PPOLYM_02579 [Paenibacillus polymyxa]